MPTMVSSEQRPLPELLVRILAILLAGGFFSIPAPAAPPAPAEGDVIARLIAALNDPDPDVRANLSHALAKIGPAAVEPLVEALGNRAAERRAGAAYALGLIGTKANSALPRLLGLLDDKDTEVRRQVSQAIIRVLPATNPTAKSTGSRE